MTERSADIFAALARTDAERIQVAFDEGKRAHRQGDSLYDNPYPPRSIERRKFYEGWCEANAIAHQNRWTSAR